MPACSDPAILRKPTSVTSPSWSLKSKVLPLYDCFSGIICYWWSYQVAWLNVRTLAFHPLNQKRNGPVTVSVHSQVLSGFFREWRGLYIWRVFRHSWLSFQSVTFSPHSSGVMVVIQRFSDCTVACPNKPEIWIHIPSSGGFWTNVDEIPKHGNILGVTQYLWGLMKITRALGTSLWTPNLKLDKW